MEKCLLNANFFLCANFIECEIKFNYKVTSVTVAFLSASS